MTDTISHTSPPPKKVRWALLASLMLIFSALILAGLLPAWFLLKQYSWLRTECLIAAIAAGLGSTVCLAGAMHYLDVPLVSTSPRWYVGLPLKLAKRVILVLQLLTLSLALGTALTLVFHFKFPRS